MRKNFLIVGLYFLLSNNPVVADALKNSLTNMMHEKKSAVGMVNLDGMSISGKSRLRPAKHFKKSRSSNTIIATVKGYKIRKKEADAFLKKVTKGKVRDYDRLPKKQRRIVIQELSKIHAQPHIKSRPESAVIAVVNGVQIFKKEANAFLKKVTSGKVKDFDRLDKKQRRLVISDLAKPIILKDIVHKDLTQEEKEGVIKQLWLEKQKQKVKVTNDEMMSLYNEKKEKALSINPQAEIPKYLMIANKLKSEIIEKKITKKLMKHAKVEINF